MRLLCVILTLLLAATAGCSDQTPLTPDASATTTSGADSDRTAKVYGRVYAQSDEAEHPIEDATVAVVSAVVSTSTQTGSSGKYFVAVPRGMVSITASKDGFVPRTWTVDLSNDLALNFTLAPQ